jgi:hypothetical protein
MPSSWFVGSEPAEMDGCRSSRHATTENPRVGDISRSDIGRAATAVMHARSRLADVHCARVVPICFDRAAHPAHVHLTWTGLELRPKYL